MVVRLGLLYNGLIGNSTLQWEYAIKMNDVKIVIDGRGLPAQVRLSGKVGFTCFESRFFIQVRYSKNKLLKLASILSHHYHAKENIDWSWCSCAAFGSSFLLPQQP